MELNQVIARNLQTLIEDHQVSRASLSKELGISRVTLDNYLKANTTLDSVRLSQIANFFGVSTDDILTNHDDGKPAILFRSALHYSEAVDEVEDKISEYLERYEALAKSVGKNICFLPEQYNLSMVRSGKVIDVNFANPDLFDGTPRLDPAFEQEIWRIADYQRTLLGMEDRGAIDIIQALTLRGINIIFLDLGRSDIFGLSICDESRGCFIFVNSNEDITFERQLFTIGHEYGHIILHRPVFKQRGNQKAADKKRKLLDKMADYFSARLLFPPALIQQYANSFANSGNNLNYILSAAMPIKRRFQVSLQSLMRSLKEYHFIQPQVYDEFAKLLSRTNSWRVEPGSFAEDTVLRDRFLHEREEPILRLLRGKSLRDDLGEDEIAYFLDCDKTYAAKIFRQIGQERENVWQLFSEIPSKEE